MTCSIDNGSQFDTFRDLAGKTFLNLDFDLRPATGAVKSVFSARSIGSLVATSVKSWGNGCTSAHRERQRILNESEDCMVLILTREGVISHRQFGRTSETLPGHMVLVDSSQDYHVQYQNTSSCFNIRVPTHLLLESLGTPDRYCGIAIDARHGLNALLSDFLVSAWRHSESLSSRDESATCARIVEAIASLCGSVTNQATAYSSAGALHFERARRYIEARLRDPELTPTNIANALCISISHLHAIMRSGGTSTGKLMLALRLDRCRDALADPRQRNHTGTHIALGWGFSDLSHFTKAFKARFGVTPRQYRCQAM